MLHLNRLSFGFQKIQQTRTLATAFGKYPFLKELGLKEINDGVFDGEWRGHGPVHDQINPSTGEVLGQVRFGDQSDYKSAIDKMNIARAEWAHVPAPVRGELVRKIGVKLRQKQQALGKLVTLEMGKIQAEGVGEVQEGIDICDFAVGLSRQLNGSIIPSERPGHFMMERWSPLIGHVGIISAFNFPVAVYFWNLALSLICGNCNIWKPGESVSLVAVACTKIIEEAIRESNYSPAIASLICGTGSQIGKLIPKDHNISLVSFTGSTKIGRQISVSAASNFKKSILELGGNNAVIIHKDANIDLAIKSCVFGAVGTSGQRCTSLRRLFIHASKFNDVTSRLVRAYESIQIGDPNTSSKVLCGPVHTPAAVDLYHRTLDEAMMAGGVILTSREFLAPNSNGYYVKPMIVDMSANPRSVLLKQERFVPILYVSKYKDLDSAIRQNNNVPQGLSSALFTSSVDDMFKWVGPSGSDCGIVNVNIGTSGAEIGGAFGGEKETGGGRESGSDSWKGYCRRSTITINHSGQIKLAQGIQFN